MLKIYILIPKLPVTLLFRVLRSVFCVSRLKSMGKDVQLKDLQLLSLIE